VRRPPLRLRASETSRSVDDIRVDDQSPGLRDYEASLLRLLEQVSNGTVVEINETGAPCGGGTQRRLRRQRRAGTRLRYVPGVMTGGAGLVHECGTARGSGYFLEPLVCLALFGKKVRSRRGCAAAALTRAQPLSCTLRGVTNCEEDASVDSWRMATVPLLRRAGAEGLELTLVRRGLRPAGGGEVQLRVPVLARLPAPLRWTQAGLVRRVRGVAFTERVSPQAANRMVDAARAPLNALLPDVYIFTDHRAGGAAGGSPGYGLALVAETTEGCVLSACACSRPRAEGAAGEADTPEAVGRRATAALLAEVAGGGALDASHQPLALFLAAAGPGAMAKLRLGRLAPAAVRLLRELRAAAGLTMQLAAGAEGGVIVSCIGLAHANTSRAVT